MVDLLTCFENIFTNTIFVTLSYQETRWTHITWQHCLVLNLLHKAKGGEYEVETPERAEERKDVIAVIQDIIASFDEFYQVSSASLMFTFS